MFARPEVRIPLILCFGLAASLSPAAGGWPFVFDAWLWVGLRNIYLGYPWPLLPLVLAMAMVVADCAGAVSYWPRFTWSLRRPALWAAGIALLAAAVLWHLRVNRWLGDLARVDAEPLQNWKIEAAEPLGALTNYWAVHAGAAAGVKVSLAIQIVTTAFGASAVAAMFLWARTIARQWPLALAMLLSSGFMVIFCGYPEKGTPKSLAVVAWYLYVTTRAIRERRTGLLLGSSLLLSVASLIHGSVLFLLPAHALYVWRPSGWRRGAVGAGVFLLPIAAMAVYAFSGVYYVGGPWGNTLAPLAWLEGYCRINCAYKFWTWPHGVDVINCLLALSPAAVLCWPEALFHSREGVGRWLALGSLGGLFLSVIWFPGFGYLSDWDIFTLAPFLISHHAIAIASERMRPEGFRRLALAWIVGSFVHAWSWWRYFQMPM